MGYSGLIYAVIVAAWAAVLVPRWIRRNDEVERARAADEASGVRVLERRAGAVRGGQVSASARALGMPGHRQFHAVPSAAAVVDPASNNKEAHGSAGRDKEAYGRYGDNKEANGGAGGDKDAYGGRRDNAEAYGGGAEFGVAARRRRRVLAVLVFGWAAVAAAVAGGIVSPAVIAAPLTPLAGFLVLARRAAIAENRRRATARRVAMRHAAADPDPAPAKRIAVFEPEPIPITDPNAWEPVPVPRPTYLSKAKASSPAVTRSIDLSSPGAWTSGRLNPASSVARSGTTPDPARDATADGQDVGALPERRRAVGD